TPSRARAPSWKSAPRNGPAWPRRFRVHPMKLNATGLGPPTPDLARTAALLEDCGCHGFYLAELMHDPFPGVAVAATGASRLMFGTSIALAFTRSPTTLAYTAHDLSIATGGRFILGLGPQVRPHIERRFGLA